MERAHLLSIVDTDGSFRADHRSPPRSTKLLARTASGLFGRRAGSRRGSPRTLPIVAGFLLLVTGEEIFW